jgi:hypothetical protein
MKVLGLRCSNSDFSCAFLDGDKENPKIIQTIRLSFPSNFSESERLHWFYQELDSLIKESNLEAISIRSPEPLAKRTKSLDLRLHIEGIVFLVANANGIKSTCKKTSATIAKDLGLKGRGKYLKTKLDTSVINDFDAYPDKMKEAILVGWSLLI